MEELLVEIGAVDARRRPTVTGLLLFGTNPRAFLPQSGLTFVRFVVVARPARLNPSTRLAPTGKRATGKRATGKRATGKRAHGQTGHGLTGPRANGPTG